MNKIKMVVQKLALLTVTALPLTSLADIAWSAWDERVMVPACNMPEWLFIAGFTVTTVVMFVVLRRKGVPFHMLYVIEMTLAAAIVALVVYFSHHIFHHILFFEECVIHHPAERPDHHYGPEEIQVKCRECGKEYSTTVTHYGGGTQRHDNGLCDECRCTFRKHDDDVTEKW